MRPLGPNGITSLRNMLVFRQEPFVQLRNYATYGDLARIPIPGKEIYLVNHPDFIKHVLVDNKENYTKTTLHPARLLFPEGMGFAEGEDHRLKRRAAQPAFHQSHMGTYGEPTATLIEQHMAGWKSGETIELFEDFKYLFRAIASQCLFGLELGSDAYKAVDPVDIIKNNLDPIDTMPIGKLLQKMPLPRSKRLRDNLQHMREFFYRLIDGRNAEPHKPDNLLSMVMEGAEARFDEKRQAEAAKGSCPHLKEQTKDELFNIYAASYDQNAAALTWAFYFLDQYPEVAAKLYAELDTVLAGRTPTMDDLPELKYTRLVMAEAMRMRPVTWTLVPRVAHEADQLGEYAIEPGTTLIISPYLIHHHPDFWDEPDVFRPERFEMEERKDRPYYAYIPFGAGAHRCLGEPFGRMADELALAAIAQKYQLRRIDNTPAKMTLVVPTAPKDGLFVTIEERQQSHEERHTVHSNGATVESQAHLETAQ